MQKATFSIIFIAFCVIFCSCKKETKRSFYYWKTTYQLSSFEEKYLDDLKVEKLYIRFFDVSWDEAASAAVPIAKIAFNKKPDPKREIVPVIYIVNKTLLKTNDISYLALRIHREADYMAAKNNIAFSELQIDCDWTETSKGKYFQLLKFLKEALHRQGRELSVTIRLHQVKFKNITGVPDVDRGMLMYYNMGKIAPGSSRNSIFNTEDAGKYIADLAAYPLPLDVALPTFSWGIHIRNERVVELLNNMNAADFDTNTNFVKLGENRFTAKKPFFYRGFYFMKNDVVKIEAVSAELCRAAGKQLDSKIESENRSIAIFHADSLIFKQYEKQDFEKIFNTLH